MKTKIDWIKELQGFDPLGDKYQFVRGYSGTLERFIEAIQRDAFEAGAKAQAEKDGTYNSDCAMVTFPEATNAPK